MSKPSKTDIRKAVEAILATGCDAGHVRFHPDGSMSIAFTKSDKKTTDLPDDDWAQSIAAA